MKLLRLAVLGSGKGSNFAAILDAIADQRLIADVQLVASDNPQAGILDLARGAGIDTYVIDEPEFKTRLSPEVERDLVEKLVASDIDLVVLAGYMRVVKSPLLDAFPGRIINIHPSLLPAFRGLAAWKQALDAGVPEAGCTVHLVDAGVDTGKTLAQAKVPVLPGDSAESLHARIQEAEHTLYPAVLREMAEDWSA
ncbi:MAG: phosphoribosylglycinamide formyltransferase [Chthoniobacterales bacterium]